MPNPSWVPIIGSGFDQVAQQQQQWAGFNNRVDEGNIQRATAAEKERDNYLATVAQIQRQQDEQARTDAENQQREAQRIADNKTQAALSATDTATKNYQWGETHKLAERQVKDQEDAVATQKKLYDEQTANTVDSQGQIFASNYLLTKSAEEAAQKQAEEFKQKLDEKVDQKEAELAKAGDAKNPPNTTALKFLQMDIAMLSKEYERKSNEYLKARNANDRLQSQAQMQGYEFDEKNGQVVHKATKKKWSFEGAMKESAPTAGAGVPFPGFNPVFDPNATASLTGGSNVPVTANFFAGFNPSAVAPTVTATNQTGPLVIRNKKTGQRFNYKGNASDVLNDPRFEIVPTQ